MSRFFVSPELVRGNNIMLSGKEAHHILDVMRLKELDKVVTFDGTGREYIGFVKEVRRKSLTIEIVETRTPLNKGASRITLIQAIPKKDKMDYIVEKATELGAYSIMPSITKRTIPDWDEGKKITSQERWQRIAQEAAKQCGRLDVPEVKALRGLESVLSDVGEYDLKLLAALSDEAVSLKEALGDFKGGMVAIAIGPEGDFTAEEVKKAQDAGFKLINLGPRVLKSDTAGIAVLSILNYEFSN